MTLKTSLTGSVTLVGAGPGDPDLLTVKAVKAIQNSDVIIYDNLVSKEIRELFPVQSSHLYVGKAKHQHSFSQDEINQLIADYASKGKSVCRLKGGDAFIFGRGGEEMLFLAKRGINVEVIPGITAASGCTTYANIPLTHRGTAQGCTFITAHADKKLDINWQALAELNQTLVVYMGLTKAHSIQNQLINAGMPFNKPVAIIERGCTPQQRTITGNLVELGDMVFKHNVQSPALIVIGDVVNVASQMNWLSQLQEKQNESISGLRRTA